MAIFCVKRNIPDLNSGRTSAMVLGMSLSTFTLVHVVISLVGIGSGLIVVFGMLSESGFTTDGPPFF